LYYMRAPLSTPVCYRVNSQRKCHPPLWKSPATIRQPSAAPPCEPRPARQFSQIIDMFHPIITLLNYTISTTSGAEPQKIYAAIRSKRVFIF
jgi:hypothetical protein